MSGGDENDFCDRLDGCKKKNYIYIYTKYNFQLCLQYNIVTKLQKMLM